MVRPHESISVRCVTTGTPQPVVFWVVGINEDVITSPTLTLTDVVRDETAKCVSENSAGRAQLVLQILVTGMAVNYLFVSIFLLPHNNRFDFWKQTSDLFN